MNKRFAFLLAVAFILCGCDLSSPIETNECAGMNETVAGVIDTDLLHASIPDNIAEIINQGHCPGQYECVEYHGVGDAQKACSRCQHNQIWCNNTCVDGLGTEQGGGSINHCGTCDTKCDPDTQICTNGMCTSKCKNECDPKDKYKILVCDTNFMSRPALCRFGCVHTEAGDKCLENECESECESPDSLVICKDKPLETHETCAYGCEIKENVAQCNRCQDQCLPDGTLTLCDADNPYAEATTKHCPLGCSSEDLVCNSCEQKCSEDGTSLLECDPNDLTASPSATQCEYGCNPDKSECNPDSDGDGVEDETDVCPNNGKISTGDKNTDCSTLEGNIFYIYNAFNFSELRELLSQPTPPEIKTISFANDVNFGNLNTSEIDGKCVVEPVLPIDQYPTGFSFSSITIEGNGKTIRAYNGGKRCSLKSALFDKIEKGAIKDLTLDFDISGSGRALLINEIPTPDYDAHVGVNLENITVKGTIETDAEDYESDDPDNPVTIQQPVGGLAAIIIGSTPRNATPIPQIVKNCVADGIRIYAPKASRVGGLFGYAQALEYISSDKPHRIISVTGKELVGGIVGEGELRNNKPSEGINTAQMIAEIGEVHGIRNVGGFAGGGCAYNAVLNISSVTGGDEQHTAENIGGIIGDAYAQMFGVSDINNITAKIGKIQSNGDNTGGFAGNMNGYTLTLTVNHIDIDEIISTGKNTGLISGLASVEYTTIDLEVIDLFAQAGSLSGNDYISGGIANCINNMNVTVQNAVLRTNLSFPADTVHYSGLTNCGLEGNRLYLNKLASVVTNKSGNEMKLDNALISSDLKVILDANPQDTNPQIVKFGCLYWYNLGAANLSEPFANDMSAYIDNENTAYNTVYSFDKDSAQMLSRQSKCSDVSNKNSQWGKWENTNFSTFDHNGNAVTAEFPAFNPATLETLNKLHRIE